MPRTGGEQGGDLAGGGGAAADGAGEGGAVAGDEGVVVEVGPHGAHAVGEGAEDRQAGRHQHVGVGGVVGEGRTPDHHDGLVRGPSHGHQVLGQGTAQRRQRPGDRADQDTDPGVGDQRVEDLPSPPVGRRPPATVDGVRHPQVIGDPLPERGLRRAGQFGEAQPGLGGQVGEMGPGAAGDRVDAHPVGRRRGGPGQQGGRVLQLVEAVHPDHAELAEDGGGHGVGPGEVTGVRLRHRRPLVGLAHLHHHERHALPRGVVGGQHQRAAVLEPLDVGRDHAHLGVVGEPAGEVGELEVDLVAGRGPGRDPQPELLGLEHRPPLVPALGDEGDRPAGVARGEGLERVQVRVGPEQVGGGRRHQSRQLLLTPGTGSSGLGETGREDHREPGLLRQHVPVGLDGVADQDDREVELAGHLRDRRQARPAVDHVPVGVDEVDRRPVLVGPGQEPLGHGGVGPPRTVRGPDDRHRPGREERRQVELPEGGRASRHVHRHAPRHGGRPYLTPPSGLGGRRRR